MSTFVVLIIALLIGAGTTSTQPLPVDLNVKIGTDEEPSPVNTNGNTSPKLSRVKVEKWYTSWGIGVTKTNYTDALKHAYKCTGPECRSSSNAWDLFGFYWPLEDEKTIVGTLLNFSQERQKMHTNLRDNFTDGVINSGQLSGSFMHFIFSYIGKGPFIRADLGLSFFHSRRNIYTPGKSRFRESRSGVSYGPGLLYGIGYGLPIGNGGTRILTTLSYAIRPGPAGTNSETGERHPEGEVRVYSLTVGGLY